MRLWRTHPVLFAALIGGLIGLANAAIVLIADPVLMLSTRFLLCLFPTSILGFGYNGSSIAYSIFLGVIEVGGNAFFYASTFAAPVALVITVRHSFGTPKKPASISGS